MPILNYKKYLPSPKKEPTKMRFDFFTDRVYIGSEDITDEFQRAMVNYLTSYRTDIPPNMMRVSSFEVDGVEYHIGISPVKHISDANTTKKDS